MKEESNDNPEIPDRGRVDIKQPQPPFRGTRQEVFASSTGHDIH